MMSKFLNKGFPIIKPKRRFGEKFGDSRFKPFLGHIIKIGQGEIAAHLVTLSTPKVKTELPKPL